LEAVPGVTVEGAGAGVITAAAAAGSILPPDDLTSLSFARKADGKDHAPKVGKTGPADRPAPIERKIDTPEIRNSFVKTKQMSGEWTKLHKEVDGRPTWRNADKTQYYQKTVEKSEIEVYDKHGEHIGVIKPSDGELRINLKVEGRKINLK
jgi:hypothetical protein